MAKGGNTGFGHFLTVFSKVYFPPRHKPQDYWPVYIKIRMHKMYSLIFDLYCPLCQNTADKSNHEIAIISNTFLEMTDTLDMFIWCVNS